MSINKKASYNVNYAEGTIECTINSDHRNFVGVAKKSPEDQWDIKTGKAVAFKKALIKKIRFDIKCKQYETSRINGAIAAALVQNQKRTLACEKMLNKIAELQKEIISI